MLSLKDELCHLQLQWQLGASNQQAGNLKSERNAKKNTTPSNPDMLLEAFEEMSRALDQKCLIAQKCYVKRSFSDSRK